MKKIVLILSVFLLFAVGCFAQTNPAGVDVIHYVNDGDNVELTWDNEETDENGIPYPDGSIVTYDVYLVLYNVDTWGGLDTQNTENLIYIGNTAEKSQVIDFSTLLDNRYYFAGAREVVDVEGLGTDISYSDIAWSFSSVSTNPIQPFAYVKKSGVWILTLPFGLQTVITQ